ncbi:hypothetical protein POPTR_001G055675v4 [Populus trichocarpa]|uniref:Uncharacterized protein n=1 Tax=Populus trichocarpa TaxID=3694 RepID=A0ACC0TH92_POPTR|nr:hypothetical protein POPTR_001G055675v4 [Populus trichocarpa]
MCQQQDFKSPSSLQSAFLLSPDQNQQTKGRIEKSSIESRDLIPVSFPKSSQPYGKGELREVDAKTDHQ